MDPEEENPLRFSLPASTCKPDLCELRGRGEELAYLLELRGRQMQRALAPFHVNVNRAFWCRVTFDESVKK
jgi:hypothetical protein